MASIRASTRKSVEHRRRRPRSRRGTRRSRCSGRRPRAPARDLVEQRRGTTRRRRSGASGAAPVGAACWKDRSKYGTTPGVVAITSISAGPHLGRLQVGHPDPLDAVDGGQLGQQLLQQPQVAEVLAVGRGVLADQHQLLDARSRRASGPRPAPRRAAGRRYAPRNAGIAQNAQRRSQPEASLSGAIGLVVSRRRSTRGPLAGASPAGRSGDAVPRRAHGRGRPAARRAPAAAAVRRSRGTWAACALPGEDRLQPLGDVGVVVEAEHRVGLGQRLGELVAVALGQAADRDHRLVAAALRSAAASRVSIESFLADSTNPQVLTTPRRRRGSSTSWKPPARAGRPAPRSRPRCGRSPARRDGRW